MNIKKIIGFFRHDMWHIKRDEVSPLAFFAVGVLKKRKCVRDAAFFFIIMLVTFAATLLKPQKYVSSRTIQKCVEHVSTST